VWLGDGRDLCWIERTRSTASITPQRVEVCILDYEERPCPNPIARGDVERPVSASLYEGIRGKGFTAAEITIRFTGAVSKTTATPWYSVGAVECFVKKQDLLSNPTR
jgi:hypothetical protein